MPRTARKRRTATAAEVADEVRFDVIIAGEMTHPGDRSFRVAQEVRHHWQAGHRVGLLQTAQPAPGSRIAPEVQTCVRRGLAEVIDPTSPLAADLLIIDAPSEVSWASRSLAAIKSKRSILVCHRAQDFGVPRISQRLRSSAEIVWAPVNPWVRRAAPAKLPLAPEDWLPRFDLAEKVEQKPAAQGPAKVGWVMTAGSPPPPAGEHKDLDLFVVRLENDAAAGSTPPGHEHPSLDRLTRLDALVYFPAAGEADLPDTLIWSALSHGVVVALPQHLKEHYGSGPLYCAPEEALAEVARVLGDEGARSRMGNAARRAAAKRLPTQTTGLRERAERSGDEHPPRPVMLLASNGVGVGHVTRLIAIARRLDPDVPVIFVSQAQAVQVIERFGFLAEYIPSATYLGGSFPAWDGWFRFELERLIDAYDPSIVVYDGNNPSDGLIQAVASRRDCRLAWVRRGLWGNTTSEFLGNSRWFDLIVEPGELDGQVDEGVTAGRRHEAKVVPPIRLLDKDELLSRSEAAKALGLDPARPSVLIQLGAGYNRDIVSLIDHLVEVLQKFPQLQICIAEWVNGSHALNYWPDVKYVRGYPLSQYFKAFDFSIAAAGYNTFHEVVSFGLPTIFIPNRHPAMDDQAGRAEHAQELHAAFELEEEDLDDLPELVTILIDSKAQGFLAQNCRQLRRPNGALEAAQSLIETIRISA